MEGIGPSKRTVWGRVSSPYPYHPPANSHGTSCNIKGFDPFPNTNPGGFWGSDLQENVRRVFPVTKLAVARVKFNPPGLTLLNPTGGRCLGATGTSKEQGAPKVGGGTSTQGVGSLVFGSQVLKGLGGCAIDSQTCSSSEFMVSHLLSLLCCFCHDVGGNSESMRFDAV